MITNDRWEHLTFKEQSKYLDHAAVLIKKGYSKMSEEQLAKGIYNTEKKICEK
jgi:hypothetical protein